MHLSIIYDNTHITCIRTGQRTLLHTAHDTFQDGRHETCIDGSTYHTVHKYQFSTPFQVDYFRTFHIHLIFLSVELVGFRSWHTFIIWLYNQVYLTKLTGTTRLLFMTIVGTRSLRDGFTIRNLRFIKLDRQFLIVFQTPFQRAQMELTLSVYQNLTQFFGLLYNPCRIFLTHTIQYRHHLFRIRLINRFDSSCIFRIRILDKVETVFTILSVQRISSLYVFQFHRTTDISRTKFIHLFTVCSCTHIQLGHTFFGTSIRITQVVSFVNHSTHHLKILYITDMRFYSRLKEIK